MLHIFSFSCWPFVYLCRIVCVSRLFFNWVVCLLLLNCQELHMYHRYMSLIRYMVCKYFISRCALPFHSDSVLWYTKDFNFDKVQLNFFFFIFACAFCVISKNSLPNPRLWKFTPMFSSKSYMVLVLKFRLLIHFN